MAQTVKIEIPIEATDNTGRGVSSAQRKLTSLEQSMAKTERQLARLDSKHDVNLTANDRASEKVDAVAGDLDRVNGQSADVSVDASVNDQATDVINGVLSSADELDGSEAETDLEANDMASDVINGATDAVDQFDGASGEADLEADDMATDVIQGAENEVDTFGGMEASATIGANDEASAVIDDVSGKAQAWANSAFTATIGVLGVTAGVADTVNTYKDLQSTMSEVEAISGATQAQMESLTETAKDYGSTTKFTATEAGEAFKYMAMAGWKVSDMQSGIGGILSLAAASGEELGTTSDIVTDALTAFGYGANQATRFSDVLAAASSNSNTNVAMMGETFKYVGTMAGTLGYEIEDVALASGLMANAGIKSSMAGTSLNTILTRLSTNTNGARDAIEDLGVAFYNQDGSARPLLDVMTELREATADMTMEEQTAFAKTVAGTTAQKGLNAILNASEEDWLKLSDAIYTSEGAASRMADTMMNNLAGSITLFQSALEGVKDTLGERTEPYLRSAIDGLTEMLPGASDKITGFMNKFDRSIEKMKLSDKWKNGSFLDKVNLSWDTIVATPFKKWATGKGKHSISQGLSGMFTDALKILPGGEEAGLTSWLSAGLLGVGTSKIVSGVSGISGIFTKLGSFGGVVGTIGADIGAAVPYVAAATAALVALGVAVDSINQKRINSSLAEHFGKLTLTSEQIDAVASQVLNATWATNIKLAVGTLEGADEMRATAEKALQDNDALEYKNSVGIQLTAEESDSYKSNIETFVSSKISELESRTYSAKILVKTMLQTPEGQSLASAIDSWTLQDSIKMDGLAEQLKTAVDAALTDGIISVDEQKHINELQQSINSIVGQWKQAESQAALDVINQKYGHMSGKDLTADTYGSLIESLASQRETNTAYLDQASQEFYTMLHSMENSGRLNELGLSFDALAAQWQNSVRNAEASSLINTSTLEQNTLNDTYGSLIQDNINSNRVGAEKAVQYTNDTYKSDDPTALLNAMETQVANTYSSGWGEDQQALKSRYEQMKPDVTAMADVIDAYRTQGEKIPQALMDSYNSALELGAASGDMDAAWGVYAQQMAESGDKALVDGILNGTYAAPEDLRNALERAMAETTDEPLEMDDVTAKINCAEVTDDSAEAVQDSIQNFLDTVDASGSKAEVTTDGVEVQLGEVEVDGASAAEQIAEAIGITVEELASYNGYTVQEIEAGGVTVKIPTDGVTVNSEGLQEAISAQTQEAANGASGSGATVEEDVTVNQTRKDGTVTDETTTEEPPEAETVEQDVPVNVTYSKGTSNAEEVYTTASDEVKGLFGTAIAVPGSADITLTQTNNGSAIYDEVGSQVKSLFSKGYTADAHVTVNLSWGLNNGSNTVSVSGGGSVSLGASLAHSATGRFVDHEMVSTLGEEGPEYVIPTTGRYKSRGESLWLQAGRDLGLIDANADGAYVDGTKEVNNPFNGEDQNIWTTAGTQEQQDSSKGESKPVSVLSNDDGNNNIGINVALSPTIKIEANNMDEQKVFEIIKSRVRELGDDIADEIANQMGKAFDNMPLTQGV